MGIASLDVGCNLGCTAASSALGPLTADKISEVVDVRAGGRAACMWLHVRVLLPTIGGEKICLVCSVGTGGARADDSKVLRSSLR